MTTLTKIFRLLMRVMTLLLSTASIETALPMPKSMVVMAKMMKTGLQILTDPDQEMMILSTTWLCPFKGNPSVKAPSISLSAFTITRIVPPPSYMYQI
jgi:hypothetical protein